MKTLKTIDLLCPDCKKIRTVLKANRYGKRCYSCSKKLTIRRRIDLTGNIYGKLKVISMSHIHTDKSGKKCSYWKCICECGNERIVNSGNLKNSHTKSCGCFRESINGLCRTTTYATWKAMLNRCYNKNSENFKYYGLKGITVCERWKSSFLDFVEDMGERPEGMTLDRIDNNGNYEKENCRWATEKEQLRNRSDNRFIEAFGKKLILADWCKIKNIKPNTLLNRLKTGMSVEVALTKPPRRRKSVTIQK
jgi:hypothetical protein